MPPESTVTLLGPQRNPRLDAVLRAQSLYGARIALVNPGWREREPDDGLLSSLAGGNTVNLALWHRMQEVWDADPDLAAADRRRRDQLEELQELYLLGLDHVLAAIRAIHARVPRTPSVHERALADAEQVLRDLDRIHLQRVSEVHGDFYSQWPLHERPAVMQARAAIARDLSAVQCVVVPGGHVGVLLGALHLFNVAHQIDVPVIAWGAGAMALTDLVVLFHDRAAHGPAVAELFTRGIGMVHRVVALPSARERLDLGDHLRMGILARRFAPASCLLLDEHAHVEFTRGGTVPPGSPVLATDGMARLSGAA